MCAVTLHQSIRHPFARALAALRSDWDVAGVEAALTKASQRCGDDGAVLQLALTTALDPLARTPEAMNVPRPQAKIPNAGLPPLPVVPYNSCPDHPKSGLRLNGECAGCWVDRQTDVTAEPFRRSGVHPPSPEVREKVQQAVGPQKRQGEAQAKETAEDG